MFIYIQYDLNQFLIKDNSFEEINNYDKVIYIECDQINLTLLPKLPNLLTILYCSNNQFIKKLKYKYLIKISYL